MDGPTDTPKPILQHHDITRRHFMRAAISAAGVLLPVPASATETRAVIPAQAPAPSKKDIAVRSSLVKLDKRAPTLWYVTVSNPPFNLVVPEMVSALHTIVIEMEKDPELKVVVFESAIPAFFINHFDLGKAKDFPLEPGSPPVPTWVDLVLRLSRSPVISVANIRGRTRGGGNEFALACDLRYASLEHALFGQPEVGTGILPGGGGSERLPRLIGRDRALEVILSSQDYTAADAERFGLVTRAMPDAELDAFVDALVRRLSGFDKQSLAGAKSQVDRASPIKEEDFMASYAEYTQSLGWPGFTARRPRMADIIKRNGLDDFERHLGHHIGTANP